MLTLSFLKLANHFVKYRITEFEQMYLLENNSTAITKNVAETWIKRINKIGCAATGKWSMMGWCDEAKLLL